MVLARQQLREPASDVNHSEVRVLQDRRRLEEVEHAGIAAGHAGSKKLPDRCIVGNEEPNWQIVSLCER